MGERGDKREKVKNNTVLMVASHGRKSERLSYCALSAELVGTSSKVLGKACLRGQCSHVIRRSQLAKDRGEDGPGGSPAGAKARWQERVPSRPLWPEWGADVTSRLPVGVVGSLAFTQGTGASPSEVEGRECVLDSLPALILNAAWGMHCRGTRRQGGPL